MNIEEAKLYLEHTSKDDFNLEEHQKENRYQAIQVVLKEIERLNNIIKEVRMFAEEYKKEWIEYDEVQEDMNKLLGILGSDKE